MTTAILSRTTILSDQTILRLKQYIADQHPDLSIVQRAGLLANAMHRAVLDKLPNFPAAVKRELCRSLLKKAGQRAYRLSADDVLAAALPLVLERPELSAPLAAWTAAETGAKLDAFQLRHVAAAAANAGRETALAAPPALPAPAGHALPRLSPPAAAARPGAGLAAAMGRAVGRRAAAAARALGGRRLRQAAHARARQAAAAGLCLLLVAGAAPAMRQAQPKAAPAAAERAGALPPPDLLHPRLAEWMQERFDLPRELRYREVHRGRLKQWLEARRSLLAEEPYFSAILKAGKEANVNPLLLFAITGQEQGFVPKNHPLAARIAKNPFNVHHSWQTYRSSIADSARIAAKTIRSLSKGRPSGTPPIEWINRKYAEDPDWWKGVSLIYRQLEKSMMRPKAYPGPRKAFYHSPPKAQS